jgi:hypothetical protein
MLLSERPCNTYEEDPDVLKEISRSDGGLNGQLLASRPLRSVILRQHESNLRCLVDGITSPRTFLLPAPYPPSRTALQNSRQVLLKDIHINLRVLSEMVLVRTIVDPYVHSSSISIVEDEHGDVARLTVRNMEDSMHDPIFPGETVLAIKQPCWSMLPSGGHHMCVDHPSDIVFLDITCDLVPSAWKATTNKLDTKAVSFWKAEGDRLFLEKKFHEALKW